MSAMLELWCLHEEEPSEPTTDIPFLLRTTVTVAFISLIIFGRFGIDGLRATIRCGPLEIQH